MEIGKWGYAGLFLVTLATLTYEILLTRIFSVTMWYHFAFMAISLGMFGMTVGAIWVYLRAKSSSPADVKYRMARSALFFGLTAMLSILIHCRLPFFPRPSIKALSLMALTYLVFSVPFFFSGICVCLALTCYPRQVAKLYAADLAGAASGCVLLIYALKVTDGATAVVLVALLASASALLFSLEGGFAGLGRIAGAVTVLLAAFVVINTALANDQRPLLRLGWAKGKVEAPPLYERWNSFSRVVVMDDPFKRGQPFGWGLSRAFSSDRTVWQFFLRIDGSAESVLTGYSGRSSELEHLKYDITNLVHYVRPHSSVFVVGAGGGRDILSALAFGQKSVLAVEINQDIIAAVNKKFGKFTGHLDRDPRVAFVNDEARSYVARSKDHFDIIQVSFTDTWAATAAGAFALTENSLYTTEAWKLFLEHLTARGVLTFSRWYFRDLPGEMYRITSLASASLAELGISDPQNHIVIVKCMQPLRGNQEGPDGVGTILVSKESFSPEDVDTIEEICRKMQFQLVLSPRFSLDSNFATIAAGGASSAFADSFPLNISAPTDDRPFFFQLLRLRDALQPARWNAGFESNNLKAVSILAGMLIIVVVLTLLCIVVPLLLTTRRQTLQGALPHFVFFAAIGLGFMLVEVSQMQRLIIFLGHPTYGLSVVLFSLLLSSGLGSYLTPGLGHLGWRASAVSRLLILLVVLIVFGGLTPLAIHAFAAARTSERILVATCILFPLGLTMGSAFPLGLQLASRRSNSLAPWLWGINGAASVCASVLAVAVAMSAGISRAFWLGFCCYAIACGVFIWAVRRMPTEPAWEAEPAGKLDAACEPTTAYAHQSSSAE